MIQRWLSRATRSACLTVATGLGVAACLAVATCLTAAVAHAQIVLDPKLKVEGPQGHPAARAQLTSKAIAPWPRLDAGAVLCRTREDLDAHVRAIQARLDGTPTGILGSSDCRVVSAMTPIDIVSRNGPAATEVRVKGETTTAWTDTWLPAQAPR